MSHFDWMKLMTKFKLNFNLMSSFKIISQFKFIKSFNLKVNTTKFCQSEISQKSPRVQSLFPEKTSPRRILEVLFPEKTSPQRILEVLFTEKR